VDPTGTYLIGASRLLGTQGFTVAEPGKNFSAQDGLHMGTENYIPCIPAYINTICKTCFKPRFSQLTLFRSCIPLFTLCLTASSYPLTFYSTS
jgi:hypothetical protein